MILPTEWPRDSNRDLRTVTWPIYHQNYRRVYQQDVSVGDSIGKSQYIHTLPTLSSSISPSSSPSQLSPPKLQTTTHPLKISPSSQHKHSSCLYFCTWSQHPFSDLLWILSFFVSKSILFNFNI